MRKPAKRGAVTRARGRGPARPARRRRPAVARTVTPQLTVRGAAEAIDFYKRAFGAREVMRLAGPGAQGLMHAEIRIGESVVHLSDEFPAMGARSPLALGGTTGSLHLMVPDVDRAVARAAGAGAQVKMPPADMFWGHRYAKVVDPFGHEWGLSTPREHLTPRQIARRAEAFFRQAGG